MDLVTLILNNFKKMTVCKRSWKIVLLEIFKNCRNTSSQYHFISFDRGTLRIYCKINCYKTYTKKRLVVIHIETTFEENFEILHIV